MLAGDIGELRMAAVRYDVFGLLGVLLLAAGAAGGCKKDVPPPPPPTTASPATAPPTKRVVGPLSEGDARALATMNERLKEYVELHRRVEKTLPKLPDQATPKQIDTNQRKFEQLIRKERASAKRGEIFTPEAEPVIKQLLANVFSGPDGKQLKDSIMDENPVGMKLAVNGRYPDTVPISTVPPQVLQTLPALSEDMEYRFIGDNLILLDAHAHVIADFIPDAFPK
jgi:hypothetical protein